MSKRSTSLHFNELPQTGNGFRRMKEEGQICKTLPQIFAPGLKEHERKCCRKCFSTSTEGRKAACIGFRTFFQNPFADSERCTRVPVMTSAHASGMMFHFGIYRHSVRIVAGVRSLLKRKCSQCLYPFWSAGAGSGARGQGLTFVVVRSMHTLQ